jgi:hypothetical protein
LEQVDSLQKEVREERERVRPARVARGVGGQERARQGGVEIG